MPMAATYPIQSGTGNVGIGTSAPADKLDVDGDIRVGTSGTNGCLKNNNGGVITGNVLIRFAFQTQHHGVSNRAE